MFYGFTSNAQSLNWAKSFRGGSISDVGNSITVDTQGNVYTVGHFRGTVDFDPGSGTFNLATLGNFNNVFISKLDASGNFIWAKQLGLYDNIDGLSIAVDVSGNVYTTGIFTGTADFNPGTGTFNLTSVGSNDVFVLKLNSLGNFVWAKQFGGSGNDIVSSIALDNSANIYVTGSFSDTADFDPGTATFNLISTGNSSVFISKLNNSGSFVWAKQFGGSGYALGLSIAVHTSGNIYTTGDFYGTIDFNPGTGTSNLTSIGRDIFISKLNNSGSFVWAKQMGGTGNEFGNSIAVDAAENVFTSGTFEGTSDFNPSAGTFNLTSAGNSDIFISKLNALGNFVWAKQFGDYNGDEVSSIAVDVSSNVYITGTFSMTVDYNPGVDTFNLSAIGSFDIYILKLNTLGDFVWATNLGGFSNESGNCVFLDDLENIYITGFFNGTADFDPGTGVFNLNAPSSDPFVLKLHKCSYATRTDTHTACNSFTWIDSITYTTSNNTATYTYPGGASNGCDSIVTLDLTINNVDTSVTTNGTSIFAFNGIASYQWLDCNNNYTPIIGETGQLFSATSNGNYAVQLTQGSCVDTSICINITFSNSEYNFENSFKIYPNPNKGEFTIDLDKVYDYTHSRIYDTKGVLVRTLINENTDRITFNSELAPGVYYVCVITNYKNEIFRLFIIE